MSEKPETKKRSPRKQRVITGAVMAVALIAVLAIGGWVAAIAIMLCLLLAVHEEHNALRQGGHHPVNWVSYAALIIAAPLMLNYSYVALVPLVLLMCMCTLFAVMIRKEPDLNDILFSLLPLFSLVVPGMCLFGLFNTQPRALQLMLLAFVFTTSAGGDMLAYFVGSAVGGPKLCPQISPNKTIAGAVGGLAGSVVITVLAGLIFRLAVPSFFAGFPPMWANALVGLVGGVAAQLGDLFASMVKRHCKIKDFGHIFPGHGGMMDRLDSIVFTSIVVYCYRMILLGLA